MKPDFWSSLRGFSTLGVGIISLWILNFFAMPYFFPSGDGSVENAGTAGDMFGGLTALFSGLAFAGLITTLFMQRKELELQREELKLTREEMKRSANALEAQSRSIDKQDFENSFFEMLKLHNSIVNSIDLHNKNSTKCTTGRDCFGVFYRRLKVAYRDLEKDGKEIEKIDLIDRSYQNFWERNQSNLGHYFRFLYNFIKFLDENNNATIYHFRFIRSQLSDQELAIIFYNGVSRFGRKFKPLCEKHALFDNLPEEYILDTDHLKLYAKSAYGDNPMKDTAHAHVRGTPPA